MLTHKLTPVAPAHKQILKFLMKQYADFIVTLLLVVSDIAMRHFSNVSTEKKPEDNEILDLPGVFTCSKHRICL